MGTKSVGLACLVLCVGRAIAQNSEVSIQISDETTNSTHITMSMLFEDIQHSGDGGLYVCGTQVLTIGIAN